MTPDDLRRIETTLGVTLPAAYRDALEPADGFDVAPWLFAAPDDVIGSTQAPLADGDYDGANWRSFYVAIGDSGAGDLYVLDTAQDPAPVLWLSHEDHTITPEAPSLPAFIAECQRWTQAEDARRHTEALATAARGRHRRRFLLALFTLLPLLPVTLGLLVWALRPGLWLKCLLLGALAACGALVRVMARAVKHGIHY